MSRFLAALKIIAARKKEIVLSVNGAQAFFKEPTDESLILQVVELKRHECSLDLSPAGPRVYKSVV
jgi:hypothetical protein